jgi:hypothetical protein
MGNRPRLGLLAAIDALIAHAGSKASSTEET